MKEKEILTQTEYRASKRKLIEIEKTNRDTIILQKCAGEGDWYEIADHSALIYRYEVCDKLGMKVNFVADYDSFFDQYLIGRIRTRGTKTVVKRVKDAGIYGDEKYVAGRHMIRLKKALTEAAIKKLETTETNRRMKVSKTVPVADSDPIFYRNMAELVVRFHRICSSKLDKLSSQTNGSRIVTLADGILVDYFHLTALPPAQHEARVKDWQSIRQKIHHLQFEIQVLELAKLWSTEVCLQVIEKILEIKASVDKNLTRAMKEAKRAASKS